jgi:hypothetical protein
MLMSTMEGQKHPNYFHIAWQSGLAALLCLGLPAGLLFWLIVFQETGNLVFLSRMIALLQDYGTLEIALYFLGAWLWGILLARISGYRPGWQVAVATLLGTYVGRWSPLTHLDGWAQGHMSGAPVHVVFAIFLSGFIFSVTACIGLVYGLLLRSWKAALTLPLTTSLLSVLATVLTIILLDQWGIRVGTAIVAMPKVAAVCTLVSAVIGGVVLGVEFSWFVQKNKVK